MRTNKSTPWGMSQGSTQIAPGIVSYSTASHGGFWLDSERRKKLNWDQNWLKSAEWWEEDCDWAIPYYYFREEIKVQPDVWKFEESLKSAIRIIKNYHPEFAKREGLS
jgi:transposase-like protein